MRSMLHHFICQSLGLGGLFLSAAGLFSMSEAQEVGEVVGAVDLLFLHPLVVYDYDPVWVREWERNLVRRNGLRVNAGSVSTDELSTRVELNLTQPMGSRFRMLYEMSWIETAHLDADIQDHMLGAELAVIPNVGVQLQIHPAADKEELDGQVGILFTDADRERYVRLGIRWDDLVYEQKNEYGGKVEQAPVGLLWSTRLTRDSIEFFSTGRYMSASERTFPDSLLYPVYSRESRAQGSSETRLRWVRGPESFLELEWRHGSFREELTPRSATASDDYENQFHDVSITGVTRLGGDWRARGELHRLTQSVEQAGATYVDRHRVDWMPALFLAWRFHAKHLAELGYAASAYDWEDRASIDPSRDRSGYVSKVEASWTFEFTESARIAFSLSHEPDPDRFGGGNLQFQIVF